MGLDALSSAAYGPEAALTILLPLGAAGLTQIVPITVAVLVLLFTVLFLLADDRSLSKQWRLLHGRQR